MKLLAAAMLALAFLQQQPAPKAPSAPPPDTTPHPAEPMPACPVRVLNAVFTPRRNPDPLLDPRNMQSRRVFGTVRIQYQNTSPKQMRDVEAGVHFAAAPSARPAVPETLDPNAEYVTLPGLRAGQTHWATEPVTLDVQSLISIQPTGATFTDGTTWQAPDSGTNIIPESACAYIVPGALKPAAPQATSLEK